MKQITADKKNIYPEINPVTHSIFFKDVWDFLVGPQNTQFIITETDNLYIISEDGKYIITE